MGKYSVGIRSTCARPLLRVTVRYVRLSAWAMALVFCTPVLQSPSEPPKRLPAERAIAVTPSRVEVTLKPGDTLLDVLTRHGLALSPAHDLVAKIRPLLNLRKLRAGSQIDLVLNPGDRAIRRLEVPLIDEVVRASATSTGWLIKREAIASTTRTRLIRGTISSSLYEDGIAAGLSPEQILQLGNIFEYDVDFFSDFRRGDEFSTAMQELHYANGHRAPRRILAAELDVDGKSYSAFYFNSGTAQGSYYDDDGRQLRRAFLRAPLKYSRISSPYSVARSHPILRIVRPHKAIDYAAPAGTPVVAIGKGRITFSGRRRGYGNLVEIAHAGGYSSRYGHFSRIARGIRKGVVVDVGDVIGFVGQTGHATGPHLHFEFLQRGRKVNFLNLNIPRVERLQDSELQRFMRERDRMLTRLRK
jgi:murein DD-endopeptidase MepM/ murein hydrolase activator NlpD